MDVSVIKMFYQFNLMSLVTCKVNKNSLTLNSVKDTQDPSTREISQKVADWRSHVSYIQM